MSIECYAQRLLNPFRGAMHTVKHAAAEAVTTDGVHWDIYVGNELLFDDAERAQYHTETGDIRFGSWSAAHGLKRGPRKSTDEFHRLELLGAMVYEELREVHDRVPFAFRDDLELWLLDAAGRPLALLESALDESGVGEVTGIAWHAGYAAAERFVSTAGDRPAGGNAGDYLTRYVNACAGRTPGAQWFRRHADGSGRALTGISVPAQLANRTLPAAAFPPLLLAVTGHDAGHRALIEDFLAWQAVWLLTLPNLAPATRARLEREARRQALQVEGQFRLYPQILDDEIIAAARVEAALRRSSQAPVAEDEVMPAFYIELASYFSK
jgi:hypothetical protein